MKMNFPIRQICHFDLSRRLRQLEKYGAEVPILMNSNYMPEYVKTRDNGVEVYRHAGGIVKTWGSN